MASVLYCFPNRLLYKRKASAGKRPKTIFYPAGIFPKLLNSLSNRTGMKVHYNQPMSNYINFTSVINSKSNNTVYFPVTKEEDTDDSCFIPVLKTNGPAYIIHIEEIMPLTLLGKGLLQGWQIIALTLVLAAISGIFMWLMVNMCCCYVHLNYETKLCLNWTTLSVLNCSS